MLRWDELCHGVLGAVVLVDPAEPAAGLYVPRRSCGIEVTGAAIGGSFVNVGHRPDRIAATIEKRAPHSDDLHTRLGRFR